MKKPSVDCASLLDGGTDGRHFVLSLLESHFQPEKKQPELESPSWTLHSNHLDFELPSSNYGLNGENGRVNLTVRRVCRWPSPSEFAGYQYQKATPRLSSKPICIRGNWEENAVSKAFLQVGTDRIQNSIRKNNLY
jgi:hypothetical protein